MFRDTRRFLLVISILVFGAILASLFFWPQWTDWKVRVGLLVLAIGLSFAYRERPLTQPRPRRIKREDPLEVERERLKNWSRSWR